MDHKQLIENAQRTLVDTQAKRRDASSPIPAILAHPRVREMRPQWWLHSEIVTRCENTKQPCEIEREDLGYGDYINRCTSCCEACPCDDHTYDTEEPVDPPRYTGPDLTRPDQLHELLGLAKDFAGPKGRTSLLFNSACAKSGQWYFDLDQRGGGDIYAEGEGATPTDAVIAAIAWLAEHENAQRTLDALKGAVSQPAQDVAALVEEAGEVEDCHPTHAADYDLIQRLATALLAEHAARARAEMERDFAIAHDRQPYPTAWAYDRLAKANIKHIAERDALAAKLAEAERERDVFAQYHGGHLPTCGGLDEIERRCDCGYLQGEAYRGLVEELDAARAELAALGPVEWQVNTDAIGWRQSTDVEVQHIRSFAVDRVRAIRVVNQ